MGVERGWGQCAPSGLDAAVLWALGRRCSLPGPTLMAPPAPPPLPPAGVCSLRLAAPLKRYWAGELWADLFDCLLNGAGGEAPPAVDAVLARLEAHVAGSPEAAAALAQVAARVPGAA